MAAGERYFAKFARCHQLMCLVKPCRMNKRLAGVLSVVLCLCVYVNATAEVRVANIFTDNMVLQRGQKIPVWGTAAPGESVTIIFVDQILTTTANESGRWLVELNPLHASFDARELIIQGANRLHLNNVLVGDVWLAAGQSNMAMAVGISTAGARPVSEQDTQLAEDLQAGGDQSIRLFRVEKNNRTKDVVSDGWKSGSEHESVSAFSAIGYLFAQTIQKELGVPVGIIQSARGGTSIELWTPAEAYKQSELFNLQPTSEGPLIVDGITPGKLYNGMVKPLAPFAIKGVLWYQGESNIIVGNDGMRYANKLALMIESWRHAWDAKTLPFYFVQLAPFLYSERKKDGEVYHAPTELPKLWRAQESVLERIENTAIVPTTDLVDDLSNIHPLHKRPIAERLAAIALSRLYQRGAIVPASPRLSNINIESGVVRVSFKQVAGRLQTSDGQAPNSFEIAGDDGRFVKAKAEIVGPQTVLLWSHEVAKPNVVRFAWNEASQPNLIDDNGWPAYPFCSADVTACDSEIPINR